MPAELTGYFAAAASAAAALIGLLFVAVSLRPDSIFGPDAPSGGRNLAVSGFLALCNIFFVSITALVSRGAFDSAVIALAVIGLVSLIRLLRTRRQGGTNIVITALSVIAYLGELACGIWLELHPGNRSAIISDVVTITLFFFAIALARAWLLIQGKHLTEDQPHSRKS